MCFYAPAVGISLLASLRSIGLPPSSPRRVWVTPNGKLLFPDPFPFSSYRPEIHTKKRPIGRSFCICSGGRIRTYDQVVNSHLLYH